MYKNIQQPLKLLMVTDTSVKDDDGRYLALEPVQREVDSFSHLFSEITWIGYAWGKIKKDEYLSKIKSENVKIRIIKGVGGRSVTKKILSAFNGIMLVPILISEIKKHDVIHTRGPSIPALIAVMLSFLYRKKIYWNKYAGNWKQENPPFSYALLKWLLIKATFSKVTINGRWPDQPAHCLSFENPCITDDELVDGKKVTSDKDYSGRLNFCFIGRIYDAKGVGLILDMLNETGENDKIGTVHFIGDGEQRADYEKRAAMLPFDIIFHGYLKRESVVSILKECHVFILPSLGEGFPKVIAESANYGCIPFVSDVSSIGQYIINGHNGWITKDLSPDNLSTILKNEILENKDLRSIALNLREMLNKYTFSYYVGRIKNEILTR